MSDTTWVVVGDPADNRVRLFKGACATLGGAAPRVVDYRTILKEPMSVPAPAPGAVVRLESPGRATDLHLALLAAGAEFAEHEGSLVVRDSEENAREYRRGRILSPRQWFLGFQSTLVRLGEHFAPVEPIYSSHPDDICHLFDKPRCHATLEAAGLRVPRAIESAANFEELEEAMAAEGIGRVFVKLAHGSAASGVLAYRRSPTRALALTTVALERRGLETALYNTRRLRRLDHHKEIAAVVDALCRYGVHVEHWVPKAGLDGHTFDLRILTVAGEPMHTVVRMGRGPITNLHLGGHRASVNALLEQMSQPSYARLRTACRQASRLFPRSLQVSFDVAVTPDFRGHAFLEANAFGDLLKGIECGGESTYEAEVRAAARLLPHVREGRWLSS